MEEETKKETVAEEEKSFAELFEQSVVTPVRIEPGQKLDVRIVKVSREWVFLDLGGKSEGYLEKKELLDDRGELTVKEGDTICAYFLSADSSGWLFTTKVGSGSAGRQYLEDAFRNSIPVEGCIEKEIKGGFEVKIAGSTRGFCPFSQMGMRRIENAAEHIGKTVAFKIIEYKENGRSIILSHRKIEEEENKKRREELKGSLKKGMPIKGTVTSIRKFGAFVDIGGVEGMIPISEIGWSRVEDINDVLTAGQEVEVIIKELDWEANRLSFSLKETLSDPWGKITEQFPEESRHRGRVARLAPFGAFVTLVPGIDGLIHISSLGQGKRINNPREVLSEGQSVEVRIAKIDREKKRLSLALVTEGSEAQGDESYKEYIKKSGHKPAAGSFGTLGDAFKAKPAGKGRR
ncbi:MAG: 30S ribosomal protein S1 [Pseudomonadota bacterium]